MAGKSQLERVTALEEQVSRLSDALEDTLEVMRERNGHRPQAHYPPPNYQPNPYPPAPGMDMTPVLVALIDRMSNPGGAAPQTDVLAMALRLAKELNPKPPAPDVLADATSLLAPVIMDVLANRNSAPQANNAPQPSGDDG